MSKSDEQEFLRFVHSTGNVALFLDEQKTNKIVELTELPGKDELGWFCVCFWNKDISPPPQLKPISEQNYFGVDRVESEVVEFLRSRAIDGNLNSGRIWTEVAYWDLFQDTPVIVRKSLAFEKWYTKLANWLRKRGIRNKSGIYTMPGAMALRPPPAS